MMSILTAEQKAKLQTLQQEKMAECMQDGQHGKGKNTLVNNRTTHDSYFNKAA